VIRKKVVSFFHYTLPGQHRFTNQVKLLLECGHLKYMSVTEFNPKTIGQLCPVCEEAAQPNRKAKKVRNDREAKAARDALITSAKNTRRTLERYF